MGQLRVLFVCTHNGTRSRIAEEFAKRAAPERILVSSSSFESDKIGPVALSVMQEVGIELPTGSPKSIFERRKNNEEFDYIVAICDPSSREQVDVFVSTVNTLYKNAKRLILRIANFRSLTGTEEEVKEKARQIRDQIKTEVVGFLASLEIPLDPE